MLAYPSSQKPPWKSASRRAMQPRSHLQINLLIFLYSAPGYLRRSLYPIVSLLFLHFERLLRLLRPRENLLKTSRVHFSTLCFGKNNKQAKNRDLFLNATVRLKGFQVIFIFIIFSVYDQLLLSKFVL